VPAAAAAAAGPDAETRLQAQLQVGQLMQQQHRCSLTLVTPQHAAPGAIQDLEGLGAAAVFARLQQGSSCGTAANSSGSRGISSSSGPSSGHRTQHGGPVTLQELLPDSRGGSGTR
jgi:hypothetical protein